MTPSTPVSICIPTYLTTEDRLGVLHETVKSALDQEYSNFEVVVCDNASPIQADRIGITSPNLRIIREREHIPMTPNFNRALRHANYDLLKPLCDDDLIHSEFLKRTVSHAKEYGIVITKITHDIKEIGKGSSRKPLVWRPGFSVDALKVAPVAPSATIFSRETFDSMKGYANGQYHFDYDFAVRAAIAHKVTLVDKKLCYFRRWNESSSTMNEDIYIHNLDLAKTLNWVFAENNPSLPFRWHAIAKTLVASLALIKRPSRAFVPTIRDTYISSSIALLLFALRIRNHSSQLQEF